MSVKKQLPIPRFAPRTDRQRSYYDQLTHSPLTFGIGPAGTGKTYVAAHAAAAMLEAKIVSRLIVLRPMVAVEGEKLGALPGGLEEKTGPWVVPILNELEKIAGSERVRKWDIEILPVGFVRGHTFDNAFVHVSEAQNLTMVQSKAIVTRQGENCTMVIEGDPDQSDIKGSSLLDLVQIATHGVDHAITRFLDEDVVRSKAVRQWLAAFAKTPLPRSRVN